MENNRLNLSQVELGEALPKWSIETIFGDSVPSLEDFQGKPLLILIFSLGCPGCIGRAIPYANRIVFENENKINVLGIHTDFEGLDLSNSRFEKAKQEFDTD